MRSPGTETIVIALEQSPRLFQMLSTIHTSTARYTILMLAKIATVLTIS
jgi:hypothetical protein